MRKALTQTVVLGAGAILGIAMMLGGTSATARRGAGAAVQDLPPRARAVKGAVRRAGLPFTA